MLKQRNEVVASSLSSYFGVGFNTVDDQFEIDLGNKEVEIDAESQERMDLGNAMEQGGLDFFEKKLGVKIFNRNTEMVYAFEGKLKGKIDGECELDTIPTGVEYKYSNSSQGKFTEDIGYMLQCQGYMAAKGYEQWLLCGMYQGKPILKLLKRDDDIIKDIEIVVTFVCDVLAGMDSKENFPYAITEKYSHNAAIDNPLTDVTAEDEEMFVELAKAKKEKKAWEEIEDNLKEKITTKFAIGKFKNANVQLTLSERNTKGKVDYDAFLLDNPTVDFSKYVGPGTVGRTLTVKLLKETD